MKKRRVAAAVLVAVLAVGMLGGCGKKFDAKGYTQAVLDVSYKGETEKYMELTDSSKEEAEAVFTDNLNLTMEAFEEWGMSDELFAKYKELIGDLIKQVKYTVGEAVETDDGNFTVDVEVEPITIFDDTFAEFNAQTTEYVNELTAKVQAGEDVPSDEEIQNKVYEMYYNILREALDAGLNYGDPQTVTMHINQGDDKVYSIPEEDMVALDNLTITTDSL